MTMYKTNYHSHNTFCDGKSTMEDIVKAAIREGFSHFGISSHAPVPFESKVALKKERLEEYKTEFKRLKDKYSSEINLYLGLEIDFITDIQEDLKGQKKEYGLDFYVGSIHHVKEHNEDIDSWFIDGHDRDVYDRGLQKFFNSDIKRACSAYFNQQIQMVEKNRPDILGHCDKVYMNNAGRFFDRQTPWYESMVRDFIQVIKENEVIVEVNTRGLYKGRCDDFYPATKWLKIMKQEGIKVTVSTDCHKDTEVGLFYKEALDTLKAIGYREVCYFDGEWKEQLID